MVSERKARRRKIKIAFIVVRLGGGGAERLVLNLLKGLDRDAYHPLLVTLTSPGDYIDFLPDDIPATHLTSKRMLTSFVPLARHLAETQPEIIFSPGRGTSMVAVLASKLSGASPKIILREANLVSKERILKVGFLELRYTFLRWLYLQADHVVALTDVVKEELHTYLHLGPQTVSRIYNPIDLNTIRDQASTPPDHPWFSEPGMAVVVAAGRLVPQKGFLDLIQSISLLQCKKDVRLLILGRGEALEALRKSAVESGLEDKIAFLGFRKNPYSYMAHGDVFVLSSLWEGVGNVVLEAMAAGTPVVATRCGGPEEIVLDGENGLLVPPGDPYALAEAIDKILESDYLSEKLTRNAANQIEKFKSTTKVKEYQVVFQRVVQ